MAKQEFVQICKNNKPLFDIYVEESVRDYKNYIHPRRGFILSIIQELKNKCYTPVCVCLYVCV